MDNFFLIIGFLGIGIGSYLKYEHSFNIPSKITPKIANHLIDCGAKVLDVRTKSEPGYVSRKDENGELKQISKKIPGKELSEQSLKEKGFKKDDIIITYCNSGTRARKASENLSNMGYKNVYYIVETYLSLQK